MSRMARAASRRGCAGLSACAVGNGLVAVHLLERRRAAREPSEAPLARVARDDGLALSGDHVVELHDHVGAEVALDAHHAFGGEATLGAVDVAAEIDAVLVARPHPAHR